MTNIIPNFIKNNWYNQVIGVAKMFDDLDNQNQAINDKLDPISSCLSFIEQYPEVDGEVIIPVADLDEYPEISDDFNLLSSNDEELMFVTGDDDPTDETEGSSISYHVDTQDGITRITRESELVYDFSIENDKYIIHKGLIGKYCDDVKQFFAYLQQVSIFNIAVDLYKRGQLNVSNFTTSVHNLIGSLSIKVKEIYSLIVNTIQEFANRGAFLAWVKTVWSKLSGIFSRDDKFYFPVSMSPISTSIFVGLGVIITIASTIVSVILAYWAPLIAIGVSIIGSVVSAIATEINENNNDSYVFNPDGNIPGANTWVFRGYQQYIGVVNPIVIENYFAEHPDQTVFSFSQGFTFSLVFNYPMRAASGMLFPVQTFLIPLIPTTSQAWFRIALLNAGVTSLPGQPTYTYKYRSDGNFGVNVSSSQFGQAVDKSIAFTSFMNYMDANSDAFMYPDSTWSNEAYQFGLTIALMLYKLAQRPSLDSWSVNDYVYDTISVDDITVCDLYYAQFKYGLINNVYSRNDVMLFASICLFLSDYVYINNDVISQAVSRKDANTLVWIYKSCYYKKPIRHHEGQDNIPCRGFDGFFSPTAVELQTGSQSWESIVDSRNAYTSTGVYIQFEDPESYFNCQVLLPRSTVNIWARIAITLTTIAVIVLTAIVVKKSMKIRAQRKFYQRSILTQQKFDAWRTNTDANSDKILYAKYRKDARITNFYGKIYGVGSYSAANHWYDAPNTAATIASGAIVTSLGQNNANDENYITTADIYNLIKKLS